MDSTLLNVINSLKQIVLEVVDSKTGEVRFVAGDSQWGLDLFPQLHTQSSFIIDDDTPFLQDFMIDAQRLWQGKSNTCLKSGFWTEVTPSKCELHLEATAIKHSANNYLLIASLASEFKARQHTLQSARELLLSNDRLIEQNEYLHTRILTILKNTDKQSDMTLSLTKAIDNAGFSVLITDDKFNITIENSVTYTVFDHKEHGSEPQKKPIDLILNLMKSQLPEFERIISSKSEWAGELCWMLPPSTLKWLKVALYPVKNELNEIRHWIIFVNDISNIKYLVQKNEQLAFQDMLTKLPNRFSFWQMLEQKIIDNIPFYVLYVDINKFRSHNEYYGHDGGDKLLIDLSDRIRSILKNTDDIARVGSDEFAIILSDVNNQEECELIINRIINCTSKAFISNKEECFNISLSIGAASFPNDATSVEELMKFVDLSAYTGKVKNKNSIQFYSESIKDASLHIIELEKELRDAIKNDEFELYLQPIVDLEQQAIKKTEALIRWNHPKKGLIPPIEFIPEAEKSDLIIVIGHWVIKSACMLAKQLYDNGERIKISINLSPPQVLEKNLFSFIQDCIIKYHVDPTLIELEVTEGVLISDYAIAETLLSKIRAIGMTVSIDDFGTGYSSLAYLKKLPLDSVKIDKSFVNDIVIDENDKAIVKAIIAMAQNLHLGVTAEGVETDEQLDFLKVNDCDAVQGFLYSKPVQFDDFLNFLQKFPTPR